MGTNYYGKKIPTQQELKSIAEMVLEGHIFTAKIQIESFEKIHIGKSSAGWRFCFNHQGEKWLVKFHKEYQILLVPLGVNTYKNTLKQYGIFPIYIRSYMYSNDVQVSFS